MRNGTYLEGRRLFIKRVMKLKPNEESINFLVQPEGAQALRSAIGRAVATHRLTDEPEFEVSITQDSQTTRLYHIKRIS